VDRHNLPVESDISQNWDPTQPADITEDSDGQILWVFRHQNKQEKYAPRNVRGGEKGGRLFQIIWGCFADTKLDPIAFIERTVNTDVYIVLFQDNLVTFIDAIIADGTTNVIFQQNNTSPHISKKTCAWFDTVMNEHNFVMMEWPPNSPDMNSIENLWTHLKTELHRRYSDTTTLHGSPDAVQRTLRVRLTEV